MVRSCLAAWPMKFLGISSYDFFYFVTGPDQFCLIPSHFILLSQLASYQPRKPFDGSIHSWYLRRGYFDLFNVSIFPVDKSFNFLFRFFDQFFSKHIHKRHYIHELVVCICKSRTNHLARNSYPVYLRKYVMEEILIESNR